LELVLQTYPAQQWMLIADNLTTHVSRETPAALLAWPEVRLLLLPKYACRLNRIEPWWKPLRSLALKGRRSTSDGDAPSLRPQKAAPTPPASPPATPPAPP
jgi:hypothetical protein